MSVTCNARLVLAENFYLNSIVQHLYENVRAVLKRNILLIFLTLSYPLTSFRVRIRLVAVESNTRSSYYLRMLKTI